MKLILNVIRTSVKGILFGALCLTLQIQGAQAQSSTTFKVALESLSAAQTAGTLFTVKIYSPGGSTALVTADATADASGVISVPFGGVSVPSTFDVKIKAPQYLAKRARNRTIADSSTLPTLLGGDLDGNGIVNSIDQGILKHNLGPGFTVGDLNHDGVVSATTDFDFLRRNWFLQDEE